MQTTRSSSAEPATGVASPKTRAEIAARGCEVVAPLGLLLLLVGGCTNGPPPTAPRPPQPAPVAESAAEAEVKPSSEAPARPVGVLPQFVDIAESAGIDFERYDDIRGLHRILESNGGGVALFDVDRDGWLDLFFTNGCRLPLKEKDLAHTNEYYRNLGGDRFIKATASAGLTWRGYSYGCAVGDFDNDGFDDLYATALGSNRLWRNNGDGTFNDVTDEAGAEVGLWSSSAAFADLNRDGNLDLYVVNYVQTGDDPPELCRDAASPDGYVACPPTVFRAEDDVLFLSDGQGGFREAALESGVTGLDGKGLGVVVFDSDHDGWPDIYVANDGMPNFLYLNRSGENRSQSDSESLRFEEEAIFQGAALNADGQAQASMGIACGDMDRDGWADLFLTHFEAETNTLYRNLAGQGFEDITRTTNLGPGSRQLLGFGAAFIDFENDGWLDLFIANGHIDDLSWSAGHPPYQMPPQFYLNARDSRFTNVSRWSGEYFTAKKWLGRGVATGDFDNDGDLDLAVSHQLARVALLKNNTDTPHPSVVIKLIGGAASNRSAIGARIEANGLEAKSVHQVVGGGSYQSASDQRVHIGLGTQDRISALVVYWPSGHTQTWQNLGPGSYVLREGAPRIWRLHAFPAE